MTLQDCPNTQSDHSVTQKISPCLDILEIIKELRFPNKSVQKEVFFGSVVPD